MPNEKVTMLVTDSESFADGEKRRREAVAQEQRRVSQAKAEVQSVYQNVNAIVEPEETIRGFAEDDEPNIYAEIEEPKKQSWPSSPIRPAYQQPLEEEEPVVQYRLPVTEKRSSSQRSSSALNVRTVYIQQDSTGYGMRITSEVGIQGIRVSSITPGGVADRTNGLFVGDFVVAVCLSIR